MPDCFISYSIRDQKLAKIVRSTLVAQGVSVFMAPVSLKPGDIWSSKIKTALAQSSYVIFLASRAACRSPYVQQELGMALGGNKRLIPVVWEISPSELPGWVNQFQTLDLRGKTVGNLAHHLIQIAKSIRANKNTGVLLLGALLFGVVCVAANTRK